MPLVDPGQPAPPIALPDQNARTHTLEGLRGRTVILFFYPKDDTPGCTKEACGFRDALPAFETANAAVLGVSPDGPAEHAKFAAKYELPFTLLADEPGAGGAPSVCDAYGVWQEKSRDGRTAMGVVRTTYLIDASGTVARRWDHVQVTGHVDEVLQAASTLGA